jgi:hypothetical protein
MKPLRRGTRVCMQMAEKGFASGLHEFFTTLNELILIVRRSRRVHYVLSSKANFLICLQSIEGDSQTELLL